MAPTRRSGPAGGRSVQDSHLGDDVTPKGTSVNPSRGSRRRPCVACDWPTATRTGRTYAHPWCLELAKSEERQRRQAKGRRSGQQSRRAA